MIPSTTCPSAGTSEGGGPATQLMFTIGASKHPSWQALVYSRPARRSSIGGGARVRPAARAHRRTPRAQYRQLVVSAPGGAVRRIRAAAHGSTSCG
jgi:hypothetical protein